MPRPPRENERLAYAVGLVHGARHNRVSSPPRRFLGRVGVGIVQPDLGPYAARRATGKACMKRLTRKDRVFSRRKGA